MDQKKIFAALQALVLSAAWAQVVPTDGGVLRQQLDPPHVPALPAVQPRLAAPAAPASVPAAGPRFTIRAFAFSGEHRLPESALAAAVAPWVGREVGMADLQAAVQAVSEAYRQAGWLARADLPPQDVTAGVVHVRVTEARFAGAVVEGAPTKRLQAGQAVAIVAAAQPEGEAVNLDALDRALLLVNDLPGASATLTLRAGRRDGDTEAVLALADTSRWTGSAGIDNEGARATGAVRETLLLAADSPTGHGELATLQASHSQGSDYLRVAWDMPAGAAGWRVGVNASALHYRVVAPELRAIGAQGPSESAGLQATAPLVRSRSENLYLQLAADHRHFRNEADGQVASNYDIDALTASIDGNRLDDWLGGGVCTASAQLVVGDVELLGSPNQAADAATAHVAGAYARVHAAAGRRQRLPGGFALVVNAQGQWAGRNLDGAEKFYLGGANGVRAYPANEAGGSRGELLSVELQRAFGGALPTTVAAFADAGHVTVDARHRYPGAPALNAYTLKGGGLWVASSLPGRLSNAQVRVTWAHRFGGNPAATAAGRDQDGSRIPNRFWLAATVAF